MRHDDRIGRFLELAYGMRLTDLERLCGVDRSTVYRWTRGDSTPPPAALRLLEVVRLGELAPMGGADWDGWILNRNGLFAPWQRRPFLPAHILRLPELLAERTRPQHPQLSLF